MSRYAKNGKVAHAGSVDSKFFRDPNGFEREVQAKIDKTEEFKMKVRELLLIDPGIIEQRYNNMIEVLIEMKKEFNIN